MLPALGASLSIVVIFVAVLSIPLNAASSLGLTADETASWIVAVYGGAGVLSLILVLRFRQPLLLTGNVFILIFIAQLGTDLTWAELVGASIVAGAVVLLLGPLGLTRRLAVWLPPPIVFGLLAGAVLPFFVALFTELGNEPLLVGGTLLVYLVARSTLEPRVPAILPAVVAALLLAAVGGDLGGAPIELSLPTLNFTAPSFSLVAVLTATPVMVVLITVQANVPSVVFLRSQEYRPPEGTITVVSGMGTAAGSLFGPTGISLSLPATALVAGPEAGEHSMRRHSALIAASGSVVIALLAGVATQLADVIPGALLVVVVGLAVVGVLSSALENVTSGPLRWGPLFAFAIALSDLTLLGLGSFFWALLGGMAVSLLLERDQWRSLRDQAVSADTSG